jgi:hypothetical protein
MRHGPSARLRSSCLAAACVLVASGWNAAPAERRCVTVTTGAKAVTYSTRAYLCTLPDGSGLEAHDVTPQLGVGGWTIPPNSSRTRYFDVPCTEGKHVVGFQSTFAWPNATCITSNGRLRQPGGTALGTVSSHLACAKDPGFAPGGCQIFTCPLGDGPLIQACFTPIDPETCVCSDANPPIEGLDYVVEGLELETLAPPFTSFCDAADGALAACPCANPGLPDTGCDIAQGTGGVRLAALAQETAPLNRATLLGTGYPTGSSPAAVVIRGSALDPAAPVVFGDGVRCVGVPLVRLAATFTAGGAAVHVFGHGAGAGPGTFYYQTWFRNQPAMFCTPEAFNLSNGETITW